MYVPYFAVLQPSQLMYTLGSQVQILNHFAGGSADWQVRRTLEVEGTRRRSWAALEDLTNGKETRKPNDRQRRFVSAFIFVAELQDLTVYVLYWKKISYRY